MSYSLSKENSALPQFLSRLKSWDSCPSFNQVLIESNGAVLQAD